MTSSGPTYELRYSEDFDKKRASRKLRTHDAKIKEVCEKLARNPYTAAGSHPLKYTLAGLRAATVKGAIRVIFKVCEECRRIEGWREMHALDCCDLEECANLFVITFLDIEEDYHR